MKDCRRVQELLCLRAAGWLSSGRTRGIEAHLVDCPQCRAAASDCAQLWNATESNGPGATTERVSARIREACTSSTSRLPRLGRAASVACAGVLICAATFPLIFASRGRKPAEKRVSATPSEVHRPRIVVGDPPAPKPVIAAQMVRVREPAKQVRRLSRKPSPAAHSRTPQTPVNLPATAAAATLARVEPSATTVASAPEVSKRDGSVEAPTVASPVEPVLASMAPEPGDEKSERRRRGLDRGFIVPAVDHERLARRREREGVEEAGPGMAVVSLWPAEVAFPTAGLYSGGEDSGLQG